MSSSVNGFCRRVSQSESHEDVVGIGRLIMMKSSGRQWPDLGRLHDIGWHALVRKSWQYSGHKWRNLVTSVQFRSCFSRYKDHGRLEPSSLAASTSRLCLGGDIVSPRLSAVG
ncbi:hypothetical protein FKM82_030193 [Ascaphus truei]